MNNFRQKMKKNIASQIFEIKTKTKDEEFEKNELGLRLLQFFEYEQDPEFIQWFNHFCYQKKWEKIKKEELEKDSKEK